LACAHLYRRFGRSMSRGYDARASLGPRSIAGGPKSQYSFPVLKVSEILECMHGMQIPLREAELAEAEKHKEVIRRVYEQLIDICTGA
jgi:hypothetical protein